MMYSLSLSLTSLYTQLPSCHTVWAWYGEIISMMDETHKLKKNNWQNRSKLQILFVLYYQFVKNIEYCGHSQALKIQFYMEKIHVDPHFTYHLHTSLAFLRKI